MKAFVADVSVRLFSFFKVEGTISINVYLSHDVLKIVNSPGACHSTSKFCRRQKEKLRRALLLNYRFAS